MSNHHAEHPYGDDEAMMMFELEGVAPYWVFSRFNGMVMDVNDLLIVGMRGDS